MDYAAESPCKLMKCGFYPGDIGRKRLKEK